MSADLRTRPAAPRPFGLLDHLAALFRTYAVPQDALLLARPFARDDRHCFLAPLPPEWDSDATGASQVLLFEDGLPLGPERSGHDDIRTLGRGRYSHWGSTLFFSASDNSDPNRNGRHYAVRPPAGWEGRLPQPAAAETEAAEPRTPSVRWSTVELLPAAIEPRGGRAFQAAVPAEWPGDERDLSTLVLFEGDRPLPLPRALHGEIEALGGGRYSHWNGSVLFSASDGSDPRRNGRRYVAAHAEALLLGGEDGRLPAPKPDGKLGWMLAGLPRRWVSDDAGVSRLVVLEDGVPLGPAHALHDEVRGLGGGRYSHWSGCLLFSTSDGGDPRCNARTYTLVIPDPER
jgi:hypothetical protein